ncbi:uncharacterized protein [Periplaneta americana]
MAVKWKSCIWLSPKTASLLIAMYYIVFSVVVTVLACIGFSVLTPINMLQLESGKKEASEGDEVLLEGITSAKLLLVVLILSCVLSFVTNILMIIGVTQEKAHWLYVWINAHVFILGTHILICFCNMFLELPDEGQKDCSIYVTVCNIMLTLYFLVVVNNFYNGMMDNIPMGFFVDNPYFYFNKGYGHHRFQH